MIQDFIQYEGSKKSGRVNVDDLMGFTEEDFGSDVQSMSLLKHVINEIIEDVDGQIIDAVTHANIATINDLILCPVNLILQLTVGDPTSQTTPKGRIGLNDGLRYRIIAYQDYIQHLERTKLFSTHYSISNDDFVDYMIGLFDINKHFSQVFDANDNDGDEMGPEVCIGMDDYITSKIVLMHRKTPPIAYQDYPSPINACSILSASDQAIVSPDPTLPSSSFCYDMNHLGLQVPNDVFDMAELHTIKGDLSGLETKMDGPNLPFVCDFISFSPLKTTQTSDLEPDPRMLKEQWYKLSIDAQKLWDQLPPTNKATILGSKDNNMTRNVIHHGKLPRLFMPTAVEFGEIMDTVDGKRRTMVDNHPTNKPTNNPKTFNIFGTPDDAVTLSGIQHHLLQKFESETNGDSLYIALVYIVETIPESLEAIVTVVYALVVSNMAKKNAVIRALPADETLGSMTVICSDETGVRVAIITGKSRDTALTIGGMLDMADEQHSEVITGSKVDAMSEDDIKIVMQRYNVLAGASLQNKVRIMKVLLAQGEICEMDVDVWLEQFEMGQFEGTITVSYIEKGETTDDTNCVTINSSDKLLSIVQDNGPS